ncbi:hypothetical protein BN1723_001379 [Verticillium longisporum]|uniref:Copper transport protein n=1 Tax=Verticillium longisporum TaxID=100787 RepID=A0A0G4NNR2_VERLO|nr:hypothetical protein BN1723_001379 [Verticillium longisporum]
MAVAAAVEPSCCDDTGAVGPGAVGPGAVARPSAPLIFRASPFHARAAQMAVAAAVEPSCCNDTGAVARPSAPLIFRASPVEQLIRAVLHTTFFGLAYIIMLLAMYYNGYIIISILLGAGLGKFLCDWLVYKVETGAATQQAKGVEEPTGCCG